MLRRSGLLVVLLLSLALPPAPSGPLAAGASPVAAQEAPPDPGAPGPYAVGATRRTFTRPSSTTGQPRVLDTAIWYPAPVAGAALPKDPGLAAALNAEPERGGAPYPVVVHSHGLGSAPVSGLYLKTYLASHGFVVVAPPHPGSMAGDCPACSLSDAAGRQALLDSAVNRPDDLNFVLDQVLNLAAGDDPLLVGLTDPNRVGLGGQSFGGGTVLRTMGLHPRFLAGVATAPPNLEWATEHISKIARPTMIMGGGLDNFSSFTTFASQQRLFGLLSPGIERWLVGFPRGGHFTFIEQCPPQAGGCGPNDLPVSKAHPLIVRWAGAFLLRHVAGDERYAPLLDPALAGGDPDIQVTFTPAGS